MKLFEEWKQNIETMASRIITMRQELRKLLEEDLKTPGSWGHITSQIGMFRYSIYAVDPQGVLTCLLSFTGLKKEQTVALAQKAHVYMTADGRISMAGLNASNITYFAESVDGAVRGTL